MHQKQNLLICVLTLKSYWLNKKCNGDSIKKPDRIFYQAFLRMINANLIQLLQLPIDSLKLLYKVEHDHQTS